eukprot:TRINITY_DN41621_c0_g1_i1.p1 TRINITY_DN41621_c0_g1~~TRINITY_DN41621_c0_g1_i1.p1  ORF type:complete len:798 (-),score=203.71 TRINITY_DN41621_c0_g1_i1:39-2432(-)
MGPTADDASREAAAGDTDTPEGLLLNVIKADGSSVELPVRPEQTVMDLMPEILSAMGFAEGGDLYLICAGVILSPLQKVGALPELDVEALQVSKKMKPRLDVDKLRLVDDEPKDPAATAAIADARKPPGTLTATEKAAAAAAAAVKSAEPEGGATELPSTVEVAAPMFSEADDLEELLERFALRKREIKEQEERLWKRMAEVEDYVAAETAKVEARMGADWMAAGFAPVADAESSTAAEDTDQPASQGTEQKVQPKSPAGAAAAPAVAASPTGSTGRGYTTPSQVKQPVPPAAPGRAFLGVGILGVDPEVLQKRELELTVLRFPTGERLCEVRMKADDPLRVARRHVASTAAPMGARFCLTFDGCVLDDDESAAEAGLHDGATLTAVFHQPPQVVVACEDGSLNFLAQRSGLCERSVPVHSREVHSVVYSPAADYILTGSADGTAKLIDAQTGVFTRIFQGRGSTFAAEFSADGQYIMMLSKESWDEAGVVQVFETGSGERSHVLGADAAGKRSKDGSMALRGQVHAAAFGPRNRCGDFLLTVGPAQGASEDGDPSVGTRLVTVYDLAKGGELVHASAEVGVTKDSAAWLPDASGFLAASPRGSAKRFDILGSCTCTGGIDGHVDNLLFDTPSVRRSRAVLSADGRRLLLACRDGTARVLLLPGGADVVEASEGAAEGEELPALRLARVLRGHVDAVLFACFSPDESSILTASADGTAKLFDAADGTCLQTFAGHGEAVASAAFSANGSRVLTVTQGKGVVRLFDADSGKCEWSFGGGAKRANCAVFAVYPTSGPRT